MGPFKPNLPISWTIPLIGHMSSHVCIQMHAQLDIMLYIHCEFIYAYMCTTVQLSTCVHRVVDTIYTPLLVSTPLSTHVHA